VLESDLHAVGTDRCDPEPGAAELDEGVGRARLALVNDSVARRLPAETASTRVAR
jgi:hypothetical protein